MKPLSPSTQTLLQALLSPESEPHALNLWLAATNIERLEAGQFALLPLLFRQMEQTAADHPWLPRLRGVYRRTWVANQLAGRAAGDALDVLTAADVPALLIGPAALSLTVYVDPTTRPIAAPQVLARPADRLAAIQALTRAGWQPSPPSSTLTAPRYARWQAGHLFVRPISDKDSLQVRLCWHAVPSAPFPAWSAQWFDRSARLASESLRARTLDATDQLFHSLAAAPALELIALVDGHRLAAQHPIDWPRFVRLAVQSRLTLALGDRLALVQQIGALQLPDGVLSELRQADSPGYAETAWHLEGVNPWQRSVWQRVQLSYALFRQRAAAQGIASHPGNFYDYLRTQMATDSLAATIQCGLGRIAAPLPLPHGY